MCAFAYLDSAVDLRFTNPPFMTSSLSGIKRITPISLYMFSSHFMKLDVGINEGFLGNESGRVTMISHPFKEGLKACQ